MAAHMAARATATAPPLGLAIPKRETMEMGGSINLNPVEFNAAIIEDEVCVENEFPLGDSFKPSINVELIPPHNFAFAPNSVLVQNPKSANPNKVTLNEVIGNPIITKIKARISQFNANSIPLSSIQCTTLINEETKAPLPQGTVLHRLDDQDEVQASQSMTKNLGQHNSLRTWKRVMRQGNNGVSTSQPKSEKKRKLSFNPIDEPHHANKRI
nr:hypothetical protein CFP56_14349 [Quercus suber]